MLKKIAASLLTSVGLLSFNTSAALAERAVNYDLYKTFYPSNCSLAVAGEKYSCNYMVIGGYYDASANIKLCSSQYCLILKLTPGELRRVADGKDFYVSQMSWQRGNYIDNQWNTSMQCAFRSNEMGCVGKLPNGSPIAIYLN